MQQYHFDVWPYHVPSLTCKTPSGETAAFALVEAEGHPPMISRLFYSGIGRRGGVKPEAQKSIEEISKALGWTGDPAELLAPWEGEETMEQAKARR